MGKMETLGNYNISIGCFYYTIHLKLPGRATMMQKRAINAPLFESKWELYFLEAVREHRNSMKNQSPEAVFWAKWGMCHSCYAIIHVKPNNVLLEVVNIKSNTTSAEAAALRQMALN